MESEEFYFHQIVALAKELVQLQNQLNMPAEITKTTYMTVYNWRKEQIQLSGNVREFTPTELHFKADGDKNNEPSFAIVMQQGFHQAKVVGQFSLQTLQECFNAIGYTVTKL